MRRASGSMARACIPSSAIKSSAARSQSAAERVVRSLFISGFNFAFTCGPAYKAVHSGCWPTKNPALTPGIHLGEAGCGIQRAFKFKQSNRHQRSIDLRHCLHHTLAYGYCMMSDSMYFQSDPDKPIGVQFPHGNPIF